MKTYLVMAVRTDSTYAEPMMIKATSTGHAAEIAMSKPGIVNVYAAFVR